jgi:hypothetical protein
VPVGKTVALSLRHSCRSELTRQGISLSSSHTVFRRSWTLSFTSCVHRRRNGPNFFDALRGEVFSFRHQLQDPSELQKIDPLLRLERMLFKEGNNLLFQMIQSSHPIRHSLSVISANHAAPKESLECIEQLYVSLVLYNCEFRKNLKSRGHFQVSIDSDEETSFAIHKSDHPLCL